MQLSNVEDSVNKKYDILTRIKHTPTMVILTTKIYILVVDYNKCIIGFSLIDVYNSKWSCHILGRSQI